MRLAVCVFVDRPIGDPEALGLPLLADIVRGLAGPEVVNTHSAANNLAALRDLYSFGDALVHYFFAAI